MTFLNWLGSILVEYIGSAIQAWLSKLWKRKKEGELDDKIEKDYEKVINDEAASLEDKQDATDKFLNRRD